MDEILENVTHALELPLRQAERVVAEACRQWSDLEKLVTQKLRILNNIRKMCVRMDKGRLPTVRNDSVQGAACNAHGESYY